MDVDYFAWCRRLECPPSICNDAAKKILRKGLMELLWDDIGNATYPAQQATLIRKNVLLHKLKQKTVDKRIRCVKNISLLKSEKNVLENEISKMEEKYEEQDFSIRQKAQKLKDLKSTRLLQKTRKDLIKMKHSQTVTQVQDCVYMRSVCLELMPSTSKELDSRAVREMLNTVSLLCSGAEKRTVWDKVSAAFKNIETSTLWVHMYQTLLEDVNKLSKLVGSEVTDSKNLQENVDVETAKLFGRHVSVVLNRCLHAGRARIVQQSILERIEQVEAASCDSADIGKWLMLALEVRKLEIEQVKFQENIDALQETIQDSNTLTFDLMRLSSDIYNIDLEIKQFVLDIQRSLVLLKSSAMLINKTKEKLQLAMQKITTLRGKDYDASWLKDDLNTELDIFFDSFNVAALRKILLKGDIGTYRHTKCCFSEASTSISSSQGANIKSQFPMINIPIYYLVECYKQLALTFAYKRLESMQLEQSVDLSEIPIVVPEMREYNTIELLNSTKTVCERTRNEIEEFNRILTAWMHQSVQKTMDITEKTIDDVPFQDWMQRYTLLLYMIQNA